MNRKIISRLEEEANKLWFFRSHEISGIFPSAWEMGILDREMNMIFMDLYEEYNE
jgi:hypothetical protein